MFHFQNKRKKKKKINKSIPDISRNYVDDAGLKMSQITMTTDDLASILATVLVQVGPSMPRKPSGGQESTSTGVTIDHQRGLFFLILA